MSEYSAKGLREKMKAKARLLAGEKDRKTDSSDWSPAEPLNADAKTGMRPISKRAYKNGGKVSGAAAKVRADRKPRKAGGRVETEIGVGMANKDMKEANKSREGVKHVGGFKKGGVIKDAGVKDKKALGKIDPSPKRGAAAHYKKGGKIKKEGGGFLENIGNALAGKGYADGSTWMPKEDAAVASDTPARRPRPMADTISPAQAKRELAMGRQNMRAARRKDDLTSDQAARELEMGRKNLGVGRMISSSDADLGRAADGAKRGGKIKKAKRADGGRLPSPEEAVQSEARTKGVRVEDTRKMPPPSEAAKSAARVGDVPEGRKSGGRMKRATGGPAISFAGMKAPKKFGRKGAKTDINIVINANKPPVHHSEGLPPAGAPPVGGPPPMMPPGGAPPMPPGMPMGGPGGPGGAPPMPFKKGGRVGKFYGGQMGAPTPGGIFGGPLGAPDQMSRGVPSTGMGMGTSPSSITVSPNSSMGNFPMGVPALGAPDVARSMGGLPYGAPTPSSMPPMGAPYGAPTSGMQPMGVPLGAPTSSMPPMGVPQGAPAGGGMRPLGSFAPGRKAGGRITKTASSYKDMQAGAASGEGRLQKTDIAKKHHDAPARKEGGRITKVAKSYKDMEAGAASGEGRLQKTDIAKAKMIRGK